MPGKAFFKYDRWIELARKYLSPLGRGLEIGASANNPFHGIRTWNIDLPDARVFLEAQRRLTGRAAAVSLFGSAEALPFAASSLPFLLNSHVIEHMPNPVATLREWDRVVVDSGLLFFIVPHRDRTFDRNRECTPLKHVLADFAVGTTTVTDSMVPTSHYHVWRTRDFTDLIGYLNDVGFLAWQIEAVEDVDSKAGNGFTVVVRKRCRPLVPTEPAGASATVDFHFLCLDLPFQVPGRSLERVVPGGQDPRAAGLPRGVYRAHSISRGFPPRVLETSVVAIGEEVPPPVIRHAELREASLVFTGDHFFRSTWMEARYPSGASHRVLPLWEDGELVVDLTGAVLPDGPFSVTPVNPPPGGGPGSAFWLQLPEVELRPMPPVEQASPAPSPEGD